MNSGSLSAEEFTAMLYKWAATGQLGPYDGLRVKATITELQSACAVLVEALKRADQFIANGIEFGFIKMPDHNMDDAAKETPRIVHNALRDFPALAAAHIAEVAELRNALEFEKNSHKSTLTAFDHTLKDGHALHAKAEAAEARVKDAERNEKHWKANHDHLKAELALFKQRPDLPLELKQGVKWWVDKVAELEANQRTPGTVEVCSVCKHPAIDGKFHAALIHKHREGPCRADCPIRSASEGTK